LLTTDFPRPVSLQMALMLWPDENRSKMSRTSAISGVTLQTFVPFS
jgi:hypothetical protein